MIIKANEKNLPAAAALASALWPHHTPREMEEALAPLLCEREAAVFLKLEGDRAVGFAQCQLRHDYVEGTHSSPVGYLEGIYVTPDCRHRGIAGELVQACEQWARKMGCTEFASDCALTNQESLSFHQKLGFREAGRIICFSKQL